MTVALLLLAATSLVHIVAAAALWRQNQNLQQKLLRVTAKSAVPHAVVQEVAPSPRRKNEEADDRVKQQRVAARELWRV